MPDRPQTAYRLHTMPDGMVARPSRYGAAETIERLVAAVTKRGIAILARIDHAAAAEKVGLALRPTEVLVFGNPRAGTPLMQVAQTAGIDLPLKALVWQDRSGQTWLSYNAPAWLATRHGLDGATDTTIGNMAHLLDAVAKGATAG
jgi:uncharacterized protein (DUF302 family)